MKYDGFKILSIKVNISVPQRSAFGPFLFNAFMNDLLTKSQNENIIVLCFVDDTVILGHDDG